MLKLQPTIDEAERGIDKLRSLFSDEGFSAPIHDQPLDISILNGSTLNGSILNGRASSPTQSKAARQSSEFSRIPLREMPEAGADMRRIQTLHDFPDTDEQAESGVCATTKAIGGLWPATYGAFLHIEPLSVCSTLTGWRISKLELTPLGYEKPPVPATVDSTTVLEDIRKRTGFAKAKNASIDAKTSTAAERLREAAEALDDPPRRYVLFQEALRLASEAGDLPLALNAGEDLASVFDVDQREIERRLLSDVVKANRSTPAKQRLLTDMLNWIERAIAQERFDLADDLRVATQGLKSGSHDLQREMQKEMKALGVELGLWKSEYDAYRGALETLAIHADDPDAHAAVGRYLCLVRADWSRGLTHWEKVSDADWRELVKLERAELKESDQELALGDRWWAHSGKAAAPLKWRYMERADFWYSRANAKADGKMKTNIDRSRRKVILERKSSGNAFAPRHPLDATKIGDHWYKFHPIQVRWRTAAAICEKLGGQMTCLETPEENLALARFLLEQSEAKTAGRIECWLGATDEEQKGEFRWLDGTPLAPPHFANWEKGKPANDGLRNGGHWVGVTAEAESGGQVTGKWSARDDDNLFFVCEWER